MNVFDSDTDLWTVLRTATAVRRYRAEPVPDHVVSRCLEAATWAPSGRNRQPWRFVILDSDPVRDIVTRGAHATWEAMRSFYGIELPPNTDDSPKARTMRSVHHHTQVGGRAPVVLLFCVEPQPGMSELQMGGSIYPAVQNFLTAARAHGLGAAVTQWYDSCEAELRDAVGIPAHWRIAGLVTAGWPEGRHKQVRRRPVADVACVDRWDQGWPPEGGRP